MTLRINPNFRNIIFLCLVAFASYLAAMLGGAFELHDPTAWPFWPGCAFLLAILLLSPQRIWAGLLLAGLAGFVVYDLQQGLAIRSIVLLIVSDSIEILVGAFGVRYALGPRPRLNSLASVTKYAFFAVILAPGLAACIGAIALGGNYVTSWRISFLTDALALLSLTPAILAWMDTTSKNKSFAYYLELAASFIVLSVVTFTAFLFPSSRNDLPLIYLSVPVLLWSALRFGILGVSTSLNIVAVFSTWSAIHQRGPFAGGAPPLEDLQTWQLFFLTASSSFMVLAAMVEQYQQSLRHSRESEQRFRLVANTAPVMIWMSDSNKLCIYFNQPWLDFTGRPIESELGNGWAEGVHADDLQRCMDTYSSAFDRRERFQMEYRLRRQDGEYRWVFDLGVPRFNPDDSFAGYIGSCTDVTERKLAEKTLSNVNVKLIEAHEEERVWIARELHDDLNQRVAFLGISLDALKRKLPASSKDDTEKGIREAKEQVNELSQAIQALSHRLHSSKLEYVGLAAAVKSFCQEFAERQEVQVECSCDAVPRTLGHEIAVCLFRVLQEALQNAKKHSGSQQFKVLLRYFPDEINLYVSDLGIGFDLSESTTNYGLGIISMKERLKLVNGELSIESEPQGGTTIRACVRLSPERKIAKAGS